MNSEYPTPDEAESGESFVDEHLPDLNNEVVIDDVVIDAAFVDESEDEDEGFAEFDAEAYRSYARSAKELPPEPDAKPERVSKLMSRAGLASRRAAEEMITEGRVSVNGHFVREPGVKADPTRDRIVVDGHPLAVAEKTTNVVILHKPKYAMTTRDDPGGRTTVFDILPRKFASFYAVGRLDFETTGVLLLTDDGELAHLLTHPSHGVEKTYEARVRGEVAPEAITRLREGLYLEDGKTAPCRARVVAQREKNALVELTLREGRNRQVRRMLEAVGHPVSALRRVKFAGVELEGLLPGAHRVLLPGEVKALRRSVESGLKDARRAKRAAFDPSLKPKVKAPRKPLFGPSKTKLAAQAAARANTNSSGSKPVRGEKPVGPYEAAKQNAKRFADAEEKRLAKPGEALFRAAPRVDESRVPKVRQSRARVEDTSNPLRASDRSASEARAPRSRANESPRDARRSEARSTPARGGDFNAAIRAQATRETNRGAQIFNGTSRAVVKTRPSDFRREDSRAAGNRGASRSQDSPAPRAIQRRRAWKRAANLRISNTATFVRPQHSFVDERVYAFQTFGIQLFGAERGRLGARVTTAMRAPNRQRVRCRAQTAIRDRRVHATVEIRPREPIAARRATRTRATTDRAVLRVRLNRVMNARNPRRRKRRSPGASNANGAKTRARVSGKSERENRGLALRLGSSGRCAGRSFGHGDLAFKRARFAWRGESVAYYAEFARVAARRVGLAVGVLLIFGGAAGLAIYDRFGRAKNRREQKTSVVTALVCLGILSVLWPWALLGPGQLNSRPGTITLEGRFNLIAAMWSDVANGYFGAAYQIDDARQSHPRITQKWAARRFARAGSRRHASAGAVLWFYGARRVYEQIPAVSTPLNRWRSLSLRKSAPTGFGCPGRACNRLANRVRAPQPPPLPASAVGSAAICATLLGLSLALALPAVYGLAALDKRSISFVDERIARKSSDLSSMKQTASTKPRNSESTFVDEQSRLDEEKNAGFGGVFVGSGAYV
jgi:23S rRNA pseudouridine2605 synthase